MTLDRLKSLLKFQLKNFNDEGVTINDDTIHDAVLSDDDGYGTTNSKNIYKATFRRTLRQNGQEDKSWPDDWMELSVKALASRLL